MDDDWVIFYKLDGDGLRLSVALSPDGISGSTLVWDNSLAGNWPAKDLRRIVIFGV